MATPRRCGADTVPPAAGSAPCPEVVSPSSKVDSPATVRLRPAERSAPTLLTMRRRSWVLDGAIALAFLGLAVALLVAQVPPDGDLRAAARIGTGVLAAVGLLFRRRLPLGLLTAAALDGAVAGQVSVALPFGAYALARYGPTGRLR